MTEIIDLLEFADRCILKVCNIRKLFSENKEIPQDEQKFLVFLDGLSGFFNELKSNKLLYNQFESQLGGSPQRLEEILNDTYNQINDLQQQGALSRFIGYFRPAHRLSIINSCKTKILEALSLISNQASTLNWMKLTDIFEQLQNYGINAINQVNQLLTSNVAKDFWDYYFKLNNVINKDELKIKFLEYFGKIQKVYVTEHMINVILELSFNINMINPYLINKFFLQLEKLSNTQFVYLNEEVKVKENIESQVQNEELVESTIIINKDSNKWILLHYIHEARRQRFTATLELVKIKQTDKNVPSLLFLNQQIQVEFSQYDQFIFGRQNIQKNQQQEEAKQQTITLQFKEDNYYHPFQIDDNRVSSQQFLLKSIAVPLIGQSGYVEDFKFFLTIKNLNGRLNNLIFRQKQLSLQKGILFRVNQKQNEYILINKCSFQKEDYILNNIQLGTNKSYENEIFFLEEQKFEWKTEYYQPFLTNYSQYQYQVISQELQVTLDDLQLISQTQAQKIPPEINLLYSYVDQYKINRYDYKFTQNFKIENKKCNGIQLRQQNNDNEVKIEIKNDKITQIWEIKNETNNLNLFQVIGLCDTDKIDFKNGDEVKNQKLQTFFNLNSDNFQLLCKDQIICVEDYWFKVIKID